MKAADAAKRLLAYVKEGRMPPEEWHALRAALTSTFESFQLRRLWTDDPPECVHLDLSVGYEHALVPTLRPDAITGYITTSGDGEIQVPMPVPATVHFASGGTSRYWSANWAISAKAGAATTPPQIVLGSSTVTRMTRRGLLAGT